MRWDGDRLRCSADDLATYLASEFAAWMDRWWVEREHGRAGPLPVAQRVDAGAARDLPLFAARPQSAAVECGPESPDADALLLFERGRAHETSVLARLRAGGDPVTAIAPG